MDTMSREEIYETIRKCESIEMLAGLLSTQDFTKSHPEYAQMWVEAILAAPDMMDNRPDKQAA